jgi:hypothetical protein
MIVRMSNGMKGDMYKKMNKFKENTNEQMNEIRKTVQVVKEEVENDT